MYIFLILIFQLIRTTFFTRYDKREREDDVELKERTDTELLQQISSLEPVLDGGRHFNLIYIYSLIHLHYCEISPKYAIQYILSLIYRILKSI